MNAFRPLSPRPLPSDNVVAIASRSARPERDFGIGYGRSSGYATARRYASNWAPPRFRCA